MAKSTFLLINHSGFIGDRKIQKNCSGCSKKDNCNKHLDNYTEPPLLPNLPETKEDKTDKADPLTKLKTEIWDEGGLLPNLDSEILKRSYADDEENLTYNPR